MAVRKRPASRGFVNNIILESLLSGDKYGYEIIKEVEEKSFGKVKLKQPSLYSSLKRFEQKGYITSYWADSDIGGRRHYYTITEPGKAYYNSVVNKKHGYSSNKFDDEFDDFFNENGVDEDLKDIDYEDDFEEDSYTQLFEKETNNNNITSNNEVDIKLEKKEITQPMQEKQQVVKKDIITDVEDENYNVFDILENSDSDVKENTEINVKTNKLDSIKKSNTDDKPSEVIKEEKENSIQIAMFDNSEPINEVKEEKVNIEDINTAKESETIETNNFAINKKDSPALIRERDQDFFSWEDMKRKQIANQSEQTLDNQITMIDDYETQNTANSNQPKTKKIFDNVGARIDYKDPLDIKKNTKKKEEIKDEIIEIEELSEEEIELRNQKFNEKLNKLIDEKTATSSSDKKSNNNESDIDDELENVDYKNILGGLYNDDDNEDYDNNNSYVDSDESKYDNNEEHRYLELSNEQSSEDEQYSFTHRDAYQFEDNNQVENLSPMLSINSDDEERDENEIISNDIIEEAIKSIAIPGGQNTENDFDEEMEDGFKFKPYMTDGEDSGSIQNFILSNKVRMRFGIIMFALMVVEISALLICLKVENYIYLMDYVMYGIAYGIALIVLCACLIPYFILPNKRKSNTFKLTYNLLFCILLFLSVSAITYAINTFCGLNSANITLYLTKLILPILLSTNFILSPIIYNSLIIDKQKK